MKRVSSLLALAILAFPVLASAQSYRDHQARFLQMAAEEEWAENDSWAARRFEDLAKTARDARKVNIADLPGRWQDGKLRNTGRRAASHARFVELDARFAALDAPTIAVNTRDVAWAEVCLFHARHELSEPWMGINSTEQYLDCVEERLNGLRPADSDGDGLLDPDDRCPMEPEDFDGFEDADGCPDPDNDQDGILDSRDRCPNEPETFNGFEDHDGCPDRIALPTIYFRSDSADLDTSARNLLDGAASQLRSSGVIVKLYGHADARNTDEYNLRLGQRRATAVRDYLVRMGVPASRLELSSFGRRQPIADNRTPQGRAANRRVELIPAGYR